MSPEPITAERTYQRLKQEIVAGDRKPGLQLNLQRLADQFSISVTPVRDAVHRMVGERLLEYHAGGGFQIPIPTPERLHDLYSLNDQLVRQSLRRPMSREALTALTDANPDVEDPVELARWVSTFFSFAASSSGNAEFVHSVANASDRLFFARLKEPIFLKAMVNETESLLSVAKTGSVSAIHRAIWEYHRRRLRRTTRIASAMLSP